jgi:hypothetical protein
VHTNLSLVAFGFVLGHNLLDKCDFIREVVSFFLLVFVLVLVSPYRFCCLADLLTLQFLIQNPHTKTSIDWPLRKSNEEAKEDVKGGQEGSKLFFLCSFLINSSL